MELGPIRPAVRRIAHRRARPRSAKPAGAPFRLYRAAPPARRAPLARARLHEGQHLAALHQPAAHLALEHRLAPGEPWPLPCTTRTQRRPAAHGLAQEGGQRSRASSRRRPCRSICAWIAQWPRRSARSTSGPMPGRRKLQRVVGVEQDVDVELVGQGLAQHAPARRARAGAAAGSAAARGTLARPLVLERRAPAPTRARTGALALRALARPRAGASRSAAVARASRARAPCLERARARCKLCARFTAAPARRTTPPGRARRPCGRARARRPAAARSSASASGTRRRATARPAPDGWLCARTTAAAFSAARA